MNVNQVITKLKVMLGAEEVIETQEVKMAEAELVDGTEVYTEGELQAGAILFVRAGEGADSDPFAPSGKHETTDGKIITVGESGEITNVEEASGEEESVEEAEETFEDEDYKDEKEFDAEGLIDAIAEMIKPQAEIIEELKKELSVLTERFEAVANEPAAPKVTTNTFKEVLEDKESKMAARLDMLRSLRQK
jgi:uncharacterized coiled-coil protein SlyX